MNRKPDLCTPASTFPHLARGLPAQAVSMRLNVDVEALPGVDQPPTPAELEECWRVRAEELTLLQAQPQNQLRLGEVLWELRQLVDHGAVSSGRLKELHQSCGLTPSRVRQLCWVAECLNECADAEEIRGLDLPFSLLRVVIKTADPLKWAQLVAAGKVNDCGRYRRWYLTELQEAIARDVSKLKNPRQRLCKRSGCAHRISTQSPTAIVVRIGREPRFYLCSPKCATLYFTPPEQTSPQDAPTASSAPS